MAEGPRESGSDLLFARCIRCGYPQRGLPPRHACPECGLHYDERCGLYRATNPRQVLLLGLLLFGGGWVSLKNLPDLSNPTASAWETVGALAGLLWIVFVAAGVTLLVRRYRRGFLVALTADGLILRLPGFDEELIPWNDVSSAAVKNLPENKAQVAQLLRPSRAGRTTEIGGVVNVFPNRETVARFVAQVNERVQPGPAVTAAEDSEL